MVDPVTVSATAAVAAYLSKDGLNKLLGPTAEYLGGEIKGFVEKSQQNLGAIFRKAEEKAGDKLSQPGAVNPRVLKHVIDEGRFTEDELFAEYFGGLLASARTVDGTDDRGVYYAQIVKTMSSHQLRLHYFTYYLIWNLAKSKSIDLQSYVGRYSLDIIIPVSVYQNTFQPKDIGNEMTILSHALSGLRRADLIEDTFAFASPEALKRDHRLEVNQQSFFITPTISGIELFIWAHGRGEAGLNAFLDPGLVVEDELGIKDVSSARLKSQDETVLTRRGTYIPVS